jgi:hypothetical protein
MSNRTLLANVRSSKTVFASVSALLIAATCWTWPSGINSSRASIQGQEKSLQKLKHYSNEPLEIVDIKMSNKDVKLGEKLNANDDWLKGLALKFKNISGKDIIYIEIDLNFPETQASGYEMSFPLKLGHRPGTNNANAPLRLKANAEMSIVLDDVKYDQLVKFIEHRHSISAINKALITNGVIIFADGTAWSGGIFYQQDPDNPNRYVPASTQPN